MDSPGWTITKTKVGLPKDRFRSGQIVYRVPGSKWCQRRTFSDVEVWAGGDSYAPSAGVDVLGARRFLASMVETAMGVVHKPEQLSPALAALLGAELEPEQRSDVLFIPSLLAPQSLAGLAFKLSLLFSVPALLFFAGMLIQGILRAQMGQRFPSEGVGIAALIAGLPAAISLLAWRYQRRASQLQQQIGRGEFRLGLWLTATHVMQRDLNGGLECAPLREIARLDVYHSGRPPLAMVVVHLHGGQVLHIVADWLQGYPNRVEALQQLLAEHWKLSQSP